MENGKWLLTNQEALAKFEKLYGNVRQVLEANAQYISPLRTICGYRCSECGINNITFPILKFYGYQDNAKCFQCQKEVLKKQNKTTIHLNKPV